MTMLAMAAFGGGVIWLGYEFVLYPVLLSIVAKLKRIRPICSDNELPTVSVLISARNEEKDILWKVDETLGWEYPSERLEVLVASDASTDRTNQILATVKKPRFRYIVLAQRSGKGRALNELAALAKGDLLLFSDANSHIDRGCLRRVVRHFCDPRVGCVTGNSNCAEEGYQPGTSSGTSVYWGHEMLIRHFENQFGSVLVCDGAIFCVRRDLYRPLCPEIANDLELPIRIGAAGYWILHEPTAQVLEKDTSSPGEEFRRRRRICAQGALGVWRLRKILRGVRLWQFASHKILRWLILIPLLLIFASSMILAVGTPVFAVVALVQVGIYGAALIGFVLVSHGKNPGRVFTIPLYVAVSAAGAFVGIIDALKGRRFDIWESPTLSRGDAPAEFKQAHV